jgi:hypothetical protein
VLGSAVLYTTPSTYIDDITVLTDVDGTNGFVNYTVAVSAKASLVCKTGTEVVSDTVLSGTLFLQNTNFWWPLLDAPQSWISLLPSCPTSPQLRLSAREIQFASGHRYHHLGSLPSHQLRAVGACGTIPSQAIKGMLAWTINHYSFDHSSSLKSLTINLC